MRVSMEFEDGTVLDATANPKTFNGLATKSAFKKQFGVPPIVLSVIDQVFTEDADGERHIDLSQLPEEHLQYVDEEYLAFLVWMELRRRRDDVPEGPWEKVVERVVDVEFDVSDDKAAEEGTGPT